MTSDEILDYEIKDFMYRILPFGYADIKAAVQAAMEGGHDGEWAADQITEYMKETDLSLSDIDPVAVVYEALLEEARNDITQLNGADILSDTSEQVYVAGNFVCTSLDYSTGARSELVEILATISAENYTEAINWFISELDISDDITEKRAESDTEKCPDCGMHFGSGELEVNNGLCANCAEPDIHGETDVEINKHVQDDRELAQDSSAEPSDDNP